MFTYNIYLSTKRTNENGEAPIYLRFKWLNQEFEKSTGIRIAPNLFDRNRKRVIGSSKDAQLINDRLNALCINLDDLATGKVEFNNLKLKIDNICKQKENKPLGFYQLIEVFVNSLHDRINNNLADSIVMVSFKKYHFMAKTVQNYLMDKGKLKMPCPAMDKHEIKTFMDWAIKDQEYSKSHTNRLVKFIKSIINFGSNEGYCLKTNAVTVKLKSETKKIIYLNQNQLSQLSQLKLCGHKLEKIKDVFLIQCYTGFSYVDLESFSKDWIYTDVKGNLFIRYNRGKNGKLCIVPLQYEAEKLFLKYDYKLPVISNQKYNQNLKLLGILLNFDFELTTHVGRKTCGTILLNNGVNIYTVKTILGHSSVKTTESHYAEMNESGIIFDLQNARNINLANTNPNYQLKMFG